MRVIPLHHLQHTYSPFRKYSDPLTFSHYAKEKKSIFPSSVYTLNYRIFCKLQNWYRFLDSLLWHVAQVPPSLDHLWDHLFYPLIEVHHTLNITCSGAKQVMFYICRVRKWRAHYVCEIWGTKYCSPSLNGLRHGFRVRVGMRFLGLGIQLRWLRLG